MSKIEMLVVCGAAGVGKTVTGFEVGHRLAELDVAHAMIDSDELDRVHPWPPAGLGPGELSRRNLAALWGNFAGLGHTRLIVMGVFAELTADLEWITAAVPGADVTAVRLTAGLPALAERIERREIGSGAQAQLARTTAQLAVIARSDPPGTLTLDTTSGTVGATAERILEVWPRGVRRR
ncbi:hypothetical protein [Spirillospora sp. NBC_01491]|uniref:hypothetical protein n=1 Tax=Spirillospora sp. NBC_01491 TaxID=2976007 RepID=UPI002E300BC0|nr:hypothetical protein [Spirillospora sp. NBC_01491]